MSRRAILVIIAIILIALGAWVYIASKNTSATPGGSTQKNFLSSLFPFGSGKGTTSSPPGKNSGISGTTTGGVSTSSTSTKLTQISTKDVIGLAVLPAVPTIPLYDASGNTLPSPSIPTVRFAERGTGYIYDVDARGQNTQQTSNTVIARSAVAQFADNGATVVLRYIKPDDSTVATFLGKIAASPSGDPIGTLKGSFLADNISDVAISPDKKSILTLVPAGNAVAGVTMKTDGAAKKQVFSSSFTEWLSAWSNAGITLTTKAANGVQGYAYLILSNGAFQKILGDISGLTTNISPDGKSLLYSVSTTTGLALHVKHLTDGSDKALGLSTLPEKCTWGADSVTAYCGADLAPVAGAYPDDWYQGTAHFSDVFWKINTSTGVTIQIYGDRSQNIDATNLALDQKESFLFFVNKTDGTLWSLDLTAK